MRENAEEQKGNWHGLPASDNLRFFFCHLMLLAAVVIRFYCFCTHLALKWRKRTARWGAKKGASFQFVCPVSARAPQLPLSAFLMLIISLITFSV